MTAKAPKAPKATNSPVAGKDAAKPAAAAPAEQLGNQPAGSTQDGASALADKSGASAATDTPVVEPTAGEAPPGATPAVDGAGGTTGQDAHLKSAEPPKVVRVLVLGTGAPSALVLIGNLNAEGEYEVTLPRPLESQDLAARKLDQAELLDDGDIEGLFIQSIPEAGFRRCGFSFTREGHGIAMSALTEEQIEQLLNEPNLQVERGYFSGLVE